MVRLIHLFTAFLVTPLALAGQVTKPDSKHPAFPLSNFDFAFDTSVPGKNAGKTQSVTVSLQPASSRTVRTSPNIALAQFNSSDKIEGKVKLPLDVKTGSYYLIVNETVSGPTGVAHNVYNQTFFVF
ncbi:hypothetical protein FRB99_003877 [Tulasnella sp. 403]|nr:hypothetical protein FRB99_003877 [Tulasnella sp. 403]